MKTPKDTRKILISLAVILLSFGALLWQIVDYRGRQAALQAALSEARLLEWRVPTAKERDAALSSIKKQLEAFKRDDYAAASTYQSKALRENSGNVKTFQKMIKDGYPQFARYQSVVFGSEQIDKSGKFFQVPVTVTGSDGLKADALYLMILEEGIWRVSSVQGGRKRPSKPQKKSAGELQV